MSDAVVLKKGREWPLLQKHHWIFSGAIASYPEGYRDGELVAIKSFSGEFLGWGFFKKNLSLAGRVLSFGSEDVYASLKKTLERALSLRQSLLNLQKTTAFRLVNGEGDNLPGLIVDKYGPYLVVQTGALGMRKLLPFFIEQLRSALPILGIYDKSTGSGLKEEGIEPQEKILWGEVPQRVEVLEEGIRFIVDIKGGQKTGFFLDQREMRKWVAEISSGKRVLNAFSYTGGFTLAALKGGAKLVDSVDSSASALEICRENVHLNQFPAAQAQLFQEDVFDFLKNRGCDYDLVILDPPAFAKKKKDIPSAKKGYRRLFLMAMEKMPPLSLLLLCSCSYYMTEEIFESLIKEAALMTNRTAKIVGKHRLSPDHPINLYHTESSYLKSVMIEI